VSSHLDKRGEKLNGAKWKKKKSERIGQKPARIKKRKEVIAD
jgi:hypothetical protein